MGDLGSTERQVGDTSYEEEGYGCYECESDEETGEYLEHDNVEQQRHAWIEEFKNMCHPGKGYGNFQYGAETEAEVEAPKPAEQSNETQRTALLASMEVTRKLIEASQCEQPKPVSKVMAMVGRIESRGQKQAEEIV